MDNPLKGAVALCAAGLLLLGGAGTYALWSDSVDRERVVDQCRSAPLQRHPSG